MSRVAAALGALVSLAGCRPELGAPLSLIDHPRVLAVRGVPAESWPGTPASFEALVAAPDGTLAAPALDWSFCTTSKPVTEANVVSDACLALEGPQYLAYAVGAVSAAVPSDACQRFGPELPPRVGGEPEVRPRNPDATGGFYQPLRVDLGDALTVALQRVRCNLVGASREVAQEFRARYPENQHPALIPLTARLSGEAVALDRIPIGAAVHLEVGWTAASRERFPVFEVETHAIIERVESMRVSWFATAGSFAEERTGVDEDSAAPSTVNTWTAPHVPGVVHVWVVLRDSRGGVDWGAHALEVVTAAEGAP